MRTFPLPALKKLKRFSTSYIQYIEQLLKGQCYELFTPDFFYNSMPRGKAFLSFDFAKIFLCGKISAVTTPWKNFELSTRISPRNRSHIWTCVSLSHCAVLVSSWILLSPYQQAYVHTLSSQNHLSHSLFVSIPGSAVYPTHCMCYTGLCCVSHSLYVYTGLCCVVCIPYFLNYTDRPIVRKFVSFKPTFLEPIANF